MLSATENHLILPTKTLAMSTSASYIKIQIINDTQSGGGNTGLANSEVYMFFTQETDNLAWAIDASTGIATPMTTKGVLPAIPFTMADLKNAGGYIKIDSSTQIDSARIYISSSATAVTDTNSVISGPTAGTAQFYYDFIEFALTGPQGSAPNNLNIDTTQVDQLGIPLTLQVTPNDPNFQSGSGVIATLSRSSIFADFKKMAVGVLAPFADCIYPSGGANNGSYRLLNPSDVIGAQVFAMILEGIITTSGTSGQWQATFTITGPGSTPPTNAGLTVGTKVSGPTMPADAVISSLPSGAGSGPGQAVVISSSNTANPFKATTTPIDLYFVNPIKTKLATYFDSTIDDFFDYYKAHPSQLQIEQNNNGDKVYTGSVSEISNIPDINGGKSTYTVLQFVNGSEEYNIYYPFFTTNSNGGKQTPFGKDVPPPPSWWTPSQGLMFYAPPSLMVFGASGVFADSTKQPLNTGCTEAVLGALENVVVTAIVRGYSMQWLFKYGAITPSNSNPRSATVQLTSPNDTSGLIDKSYMSSFRIANIPMTIDIPSGNPLTSFTVESPLDILPTPSDLLSFAQFYPKGGVWSAFANFLHNSAGYNIMIDGRAYALPYDDQGGFSSDLNASTSVANPASVTVTMGSWA